MKTQRAAIMILAHIDPNKAIEKLRDLNEESHVWLKEVRLKDMQEKVEAVEQMAKEPMYVIPLDDDDDNEGILSLYRDNGFQR